MRMSYAIAAASAPVRPMGECVQHRYIDPPRSVVLFASIESAEGECALRAIERDKMVAEWQA